MTDSGRSLRECFSKAKSQQESLDALDTSSPTYTDNLQSAILAYEECRKLISQFALFSPNEEIEDVATNDIQYLAVDYLLSELYLRSYGSDRPGTLRKSLMLLENFLEMLEVYGILHSEDKKLLKKFQENKKGFSIASSSDMAERRRVKVERFQEEKELKSKLQYLRTKSGSLNADDETVRQLYLIEIQLHANQSFRSLDMTVQELSMLAHIQSLPTPPTQQDDRQEARSRETYSDRLDGPVGGLGRKGGPLLSKEGKPLQPFTLTDKRTQLRQGVFRPGHNLPTMSIDEYLEEEKRRGGIIEGGGPSSGVAPEPDEDNMDLVDAETMKAREWDEFTEANPKGAGNTINRG